MEQEVMTELLTRLRFALAALQGRPIARHLTVTDGTLEHNPKQLTEDCNVRASASLVIEIGTPIALTDDELDYMRKQLAAAG